MYIFYIVVLGAALTGISKSKGQEYDISLFPRPVSVVAPSNSNIGKNKLKPTSGHILGKSPQVCSPSQATSIVVNEQQRQSPSGFSGANGIPQDSVLVNEPSSVAVTRCLQTVPSNNTMPNTLSQLSSSNVQMSEANEEHEIMYDKHRQLIKEISLVGHILHIFNLKEKPYISSAEVSSLFPRWKKKDHLRKMMKLKKQNIPCVEISRISAQEDHEWFFEQCLIEDVLGMETTDEELVDSVTLYPMEYIATMLSLFGSGGGLTESEITRLSDAVKLEYQGFNPHDEFWSSIS